MVQVTPEVTRCLWRSLCIPRSPSDLFPQKLLARVYHHWNWCLLTALLEVVGSDLLPQTYLIYARFPRGFLAQVWSCWGSWLKTTLAEVAGLGLFTHICLAPAYSLGCSWLRSGPTEVSDLGLLPQSSYFYRGCSSTGHWFRPVPIDFPYLGMLLWGFLAWAQPHRGLWLGLAPSEVPDSHRGPCLSSTTILLMILLLIYPQSMMDLGAR